MTFYTVSQIAPEVGIVGGGGTGAKAVATVSGGRVVKLSLTIGGRGYTRIPEVRIAAPTDPGPSVTLWSNDGTSVGGSEPTASVTMNLLAGTYSALLGYGGLPDMAALPREVLAHLDARVRVWDGKGGTFLRDVIDRPLQSVPYAEEATTADFGTMVPDGSITIAKLAPDVLGTPGLPGLQGPQGPVGPRGAAGPAGPQGVPGATGSVGPAGAIGPMGITGLTGTAGPAGTTGAQGLIGLTGLAGPTGTIEPKGDTGLPGATGATGPQGSGGLTGPAGAIGLKGDTGLTGPIGPTGATGAQGSIGLTGPTGPVGPAGPAGNLPPGAMVASLSSEDSSLTTAGYQRILSISAKDWTSPVASGAPSARTRHTSAWMGSKFIVWGGEVSGVLSNQGGDYSPGTNVWTTLPTTNAPAARADHTVVCSASQMIVWGGVAAGGETAAGGVYDPAARVWRATATTGAPIERTAHTAVWAGDRMIVWGGGNPGGTLGNGAAFFPNADISQSGPNGTWSALTTTGTPAARFGHTAIWTGNKMIVFGGAKTDVIGSASDLFGDGTIFDPATGIWIPLPATGAPSARFHHGAVWTGSEMIVFGGEGVAGAAITSAAAFDPARNTWRTLPSQPTGATRATGAWSGQLLLTFSGAGLITLDPTPSVFLYSKF